MLSLWSTLRSLLLILLAKRIRIQVINWKSASVSCQRVLTESRVIKQHFHYYRISKYVQKYHTIIAIWSCQILQKILWNHCYLKEIVEYKETEVAQGRKYLWCTILINPDNGHQQNTHNCNYKELQRKLKFENIRCINQV